MPSEIEVKVVREILEMACTEEAFARLRQLLIAEIPAGDPTEGKPETVRTIMIGTKPAPTVEPRRRDSELVALIGCALVGTVIVTLLIVGLGTVVGWIQ